MRGEVLVLEGCAPTPLASYLKALGVLRLISSPGNHVSGEAADPCVRGWWENERFCLRTMLSRDDLRQFLLHSYAPSPIVAPWNGGSGFYPKDNRDGFEPLSRTDVAERFSSISSAIARSTRAINELALTQKPEKAAKVELVETLRSRFPDSALRWLDAVLALSGDVIAYPELLGTGGNDGRLEFTNNFMRRLVSPKKPMGLFDAVSGSPSHDSEQLLESALFAAPAWGLSSAAVGHFSPGAAGGPNATTGYKSGSEANSWDYVLTLEGAAIFAVATSRRYERTGAAGATTRSGASFPFTVQAVGAGWGGVDASDEVDARAEFWAPLWNRPARCVEIESLLGEGRAILNGRTVKDGLGFSRAAASLGVSRGFREFQRFGFLMRAGRTFLATPLGRRPAEPARGARLVGDLDRRGWLGRVRRVGRGGSQPASARLATKRLEDALFDLLVSAVGPEAVEQALVALGVVVRWLALSRGGREWAASPPPLLSVHWVRWADDRSPEFRVAAALAGIGLPGWFGVGGRGSKSEVAGADKRTEVRGAEEPLAKTVNLPATLAPPMAAHFGPLEEKSFFRHGRLSLDRAWVDDSPTTVWGAGPLVSNMIAVLERRLAEASIRGLEGKPLAGATVARLADVAAFLSGDFDDARCAALLAGLVWARPAPLASGGSGGQTEERPVPFAYAALKPLFTQEGDLRAVGALSDTARMPVPPGLVARLRAGGGSRDGSATGAAVQLAMARSRASGLATSFDPARSSRSQQAGSFGRMGAGVAADRLAASLLIPVGEGALKRLIQRAYPGTLPNDDDAPIDPNLEDATNAM